MTIESEGLVAIAEVRGTQLLDGLRPLAAGAIEVDHAIGVVAEALDEAAA